MTSKNNMNPSFDNKENIDSLAGTQDMNSSTKRGKPLHKARRPLAEIGNRILNINHNNLDPKNKSKGGALSELSKSTNYNNSYNTDCIASRTRTKRRRAEEDKKENAKICRLRLDESSVLPANILPLLRSHSSKKDTRMLSDNDVAYAVSLELPSGAVDVDASDSSKLGIPIMREMREREFTMCPRADYMDIQSKKIDRYRRILMDWIVDVHAHFRLRPETLYLCANILDRFLSKKIVPKQKLQLVGVTCLMIAWKYEEIIPPKVNNLIDMAVKSFTRSDLFRMEALILNVLDFCLTVATPLSFVSRILKAASLLGASSNVTFFAHYVLELTLCDYNSLRFQPSLLAASAVYLALQKEIPWNDTFIFHSGGYNEQDLAECVAYLHNVMAVNEETRNAKYSAVRHKYSARKYGKIAIVVDGALALE